MNKILILGTGELGHAIIVSFLRHSAFNPSKHSISTTIRPSTLSSSELLLSKIDQIRFYKSQNVDLIALDIESMSVEALTEQFREFTTIIHAGGMTIAPGTQMKVTRAVLASAEPPSAASQTKLYIPWQFGLDYDAIGPSAGDGLFAEQCSIREILRSQTEVEWVIVSNGIFMSFMFEPFWGIVEPGNGSSNDGHTNKLTVRALGSWEDKLVVTRAEDIARCTTELVLVDTESRGKPVFIAGDSIAYGDVADMVERISGQKVQREVWSTKLLEQKMLEKPEDKLRKYHVVFSSGVGTNWNMEETYNIQKGIEMEGVEEWLQKNFKSR